MAGLRMRRRVSGSAAAIAVFAAVLVFSGCMAPLGILADLTDRVARANFDYGTRTVATGANYAASLAVNGDSLYLLYYDSALQKLRIVKSPDKGKTWNAPFTVDNTTTNYGTSNNLVVDGSNVYIVYQRSGDGHDSIYFLQLADAGNSFTPSNFQRISTYSAYQEGYENSIACDASNVYIVFSEGGAVAYTYAAKGASMNFPDPVCVDSALDTPESSNCGGRKLTSTVIDVNNGNVNICYFDDVNNLLKMASFAPSAALPIAVLPITYLPGPTSVPAAGYPSIATVYGNLRLISYYDTTNRTLNFLEKLSYGKPPLMMLYFSNVMRVEDSTSADVGRATQSLFLSNTVHIAYYDNVNKQIKYARGVKIPWNPSPDTPPYYSFTKSVIDTVGGANIRCSLASDGTTLYIAYYDSAAGGELKLAKSMNGGVSW
jgi:hypothetical protein